MAAGVRNRCTGGLGIGDVEADRVDACAVVAEEVVKLRWPAGGGDDEIAGIERGPGDGAAQAT